MSKSTKKVLPLQPISVKFTPIELETIQKTAESKGLTRHKFIRETVLKACDG